MHVLASSLSGNLGGLAEYESGRFRLPKSLQEDYLFSQSNTKSTGYKDKWAVEVFRNWQAVREQKFPSVDPGSVFKDYDVHRVQGLQEKKEDLDSLSLNYIGSQNSFKDVKVNDYEVSVFLNKFPEL